MGFRKAYLSAQIRLYRDISRRTSSRSLAWFAKPIEILLNKLLVMLMQKSFGKCLAKNEEVFVIGFERSEISSCYDMLGL
ncbi:hypothetical protein FOMG_19215 [Fusarium oxysporum f. sp. melonis 26406]|uniref:Uncharacterized protein n=1 Tax=Fusarium oxysporum f. sp. melonis 26406 TaxID=1089452 RepID=W9YWY0_FUSOX|nr:hypothetical protein FOMG_19215 [Fusarium oxysporum f. sp. melonis 26406]